MPPRELAVICEFHDGMKTCVGSYDGEGSDKFDLWRGLRQRCVLAPLLLNTFLTAVLRGAETHFIADATIMDNTVRLQQKKGEKNITSHACKVDGRRGQDQEVQILYGMLYVDNAGIISRSSEGLQRM